MIPRRNSEPDPVSPDNAACEMLMIFHRPASRPPLPVCVDICDVGGKHTDAREQFGCEDCFI
jgi:hypothetical protein